MFANILSWFSKEATSNSTSNATTNIESHQPTSPEAPSTVRMVTEQPNSEENMLKLRGGGASDICCGLCAGLLCFECCEHCC
ncbi:hypothetical protein E8E15_008551 [Penicillium rubens]|uniref:Pc21g18940 protein n=2 Tax=Penicillium chrysogenum species complex TaxID=254878 RepID=B6HIM7_PENRW|nr:uncharacterized protein N7525_006648 [Penicillium rubens]XP_056570513.1 uncharacterized protein N7489_000456 [Penicillium chrysogenum]CAP96791.1 Pc21g18940 [Penicillium rubens Wisconsin 54-1255]KAF3019216.1 hypothetical protein E8E15_008551 [Penicillium rubens]KAJ5049911.1 hypothetical protein NUH16_008434 [Penicillium rubens]KAJ5250046.1 hypothetical protein N7489_000456 [Penicillium chrysogenum]KAJ5265666.1 hypothetical protein N7524_006684 [Penicillium chrysogenum]